MSKNLKNVSRQGWGTVGENPTSEEIQTGCLQRIADALEVMSKNYVELLRQIEAEKARAYRNFSLLQNSKAENAQLKLSIKGYKSHITRLQKKVAEFENMPIYEIDSVQELKIITPDQTEEK
ncbi:MAG: hypothetical protein LUM44_09975 [Pyrinomonadaceae bacterium]|nr:hypothetical protein [Pyrinomonadaceae bacterium]